VALIAACGVAASGATATAGASSAKVPRCEKVTVKGKRWGVYIEKGTVSCATAGTVLKGVLAGKGKSVDKGPANAYIVYDGWVCPYDQMGVLTCESGTKPVANPGRTIFALSCSTAVGEPACPARSEE
jgi:hypothetical protein